MRFLGKNKSDYLYANFKNVLTICYHFSYIGFSCMMLYCIQVFRVLLKLFIYRDSTPNLLISFGFVVQMNLVVGSLGNAIKIFGNHWHVSCYCSAWTTIFYPRIFGMLSKNAVFFGSNLFVTQKLTVYFRGRLVSPYFYANFDHLLEICCDQS